MSSIHKRKATTSVGGSAKKVRPNANIASFFNSPAPKPAPATSSRPFSTSKFDKAAWVTSLTEEQRGLLQLEIDTLHESWLAELKDEIVTKEFLDLKRFLDREVAAGTKIFPPREDIYSWYDFIVSHHSARSTTKYPHRSRHTPFHEVKVVIVGQDPYHNDGQAHGLAFSVRPPTIAPPSLKNMYKALAIDYPDFVPPSNRGGLLTPWADRGVLLLNTCLTVRAHNANSHANRGWERFTQRVIDLVAARRTRGVVYMAWGTPAGKRVAKIDQKRHLVLKSVHPSPLSASRGFFDCGHFKKANEWLKVTYGADAEIDWSLGPHTTSTATVADGAKSKVADYDLDESEEEAFAAVAEDQNMVNVMGPPPTPSPRKGDRVTTPVKLQAKSQGGMGKENEKVDLPA